MLRTQEEMAEYFAKLKERSGLSWPEIAKAAGYKGQSGIQRYYTPGAGNKAHLPPELIKGLMSCMLGVGTPPITEEEILRLAGAFAVPRSSGLSEAAFAGASIGSTAGKIPVFGYAAATNGREATNTDLDPPIDWVEPIPGVANVQGAYALLIQDDSMEPRYYHGDIVFVNPRRVPKIGKDAIVENHDGNAEIKRYMGKEKDHYNFQQLNPLKKISKHAREIKGIYAVMGRGE